MENQEYSRYILESEFTNNNSGNGRWTFARKEGNEYFLKEFLSPVYPIDESIFSEERLKEKKEICENFEKEKTWFYRKLNEASDGNSVRVQSFSRHESKYYMTMKRVRSLNYVPQNVSELSYEQKLLFCSVLAHSLMRLHQAGIIHADLKWDNLIFTQGKGKKAITVKLIDFDNSFMIGRQPDREELGIDPAYCAPETAAYLSGKPIALNDKIDVFAMGIIYHQIFSGKIPSAEIYQEETIEHRYVFEYLLDGKALKIDSEIPAHMAVLIGTMLRLESHMRPSMKRVFEQLSPLVKMIKNTGKQDTEEKDGNTDSIQDMKIMEKNKIEDISREEWIDQHKAIKGSDGWFGAPGGFGK